VTVAADTRRLRGEVGIGSTSALSKHADDSAASRSLGSRVAFAIFASLCVAILVGLGIWQLERRVWKLDLIARVEQRLHAAPAPAPGPASWPRINAAADAYRHVRAKGHFLGVAPALALAVTERGAGYWVLSPFRTDDGFTVLVNRGFVPSDHSSLQDLGKASGETTITGLLRVSEPAGAFLRHNDPAADRWYSRDVTAIAASRGLGNVAPYFIDADASVDRSKLPIGGLTVITFPNNHLIYALTWFGLAAMLVARCVHAEWRERRSQDI
jgi:surfeit locus 1 family protein